MLQALAGRNFTRVKPATNSIYLMPKRKLNQQADAIFDVDQGESPNPTKKARSEKAQGKTKSNHSPPQVPPRPQSLWKVGAHVSAAGGVENAITNAAAIGANAFALFVKSQRKWSSPPLQESTISSFRAKMVENGYDSRHVLPHGSYLINLGNPDADKRQKSYDCFVDDLKRCEALGLLLYNFHPGSSVGQATTDQSISLIAQCINQAHRATRAVVTVIENMAGAGNIIGGDFRHLGNIIKQVEDKARVGVCLDTCHMFAAGYDLRTKEGWDKIVIDFDEQVGLSYLRGMHLNDSKTDLNSHRDRHENIGLGHIGMQGFHHILNDRRFQDIPLILETPSFEKPEVWAAEIAALNRMSSVSVDSEELTAAVASVGEVVKRASAGVKAKGKKSPKKTAKKGKKVKDDEDEDEGSDYEE